MRCGPCNDVDPMRAARRRWRARNPEYEAVHERARKAKTWASLTPAERDAERERIRLYRATHPVEAYISNLRSRRQRERTQREGTE